MGRRGESRSFLGPRSRAASEIAEGVAGMAVGQGEPQFWFGNRGGQAARRLEVGEVGFGEGAAGGELAGLDRRRLTRGRAETVYGEPGDGRDNRDGRGGDETCQRPAHALQMRRPNHMMRPAMWRSGTSDAGMVSRG